MSNKDIDVFQSIDEVNDEQWYKAFKKTSAVLTRILSGRTGKGAFADTVFGIPAVDHFTAKAFDKLFLEKWTFLPGVPLSSQMIRIARSEMSHHLDAWRNNPGPNFEPIDEQLLEDLRDEDDTLDVTYERAEAAAKNDPDLLEMLRQMRRCDSYEAIAEEMNITVKDVYVLRRKLKRRLEQK